MVSCVLIFNGQISIKHLKNITGKSMFLQHKLTWKCFYFSVPMESLYSIV